MTKVPLLFHVIFVYYMPVINADSKPTSTDSRSCFGVFCKFYFQLDKTKHVLLLWVDHPEF